jgi:hypothetical protein
VRRIIGKRKKNWWKNQNAKKGEWINHDPYIYKEKSQNKTKI